MSGLSADDLRKLNGCVHMSQIVWHSPFEHKDSVAAHDSALIDAVAKRVEDDKEAVEIMREALHRIERECDGEAYAIALDALEATDQLVGWYA